MLRPLRDMRSKANSMFRRIHKSNSLHDKSVRPRLDRLEDRLLLATFMVTNTDDSGTGSLRQAILDSNATSGPNRIAFQIGTGGLQTIRVGATTGTVLPDITTAVDIDATSQPGYMMNAPVIELQRFPGPLLGPGFTVRASNSKIRGFVIESFSRSGILIEDGGVNEIIDNFVGIDPTGTSCRANFNGIEVMNSSDNKIKRNLIACHSDAIGHFGVGITATAGRASQRNIVSANTIGTDITRRFALSNDNGIFVGAGDAAATVSDTYVGPIIDGGKIFDGNFIAGNDVSGVFIVVAATNTDINQNVIGVRNLPNWADGVVIEGASGNTVGANVIFYNNRQDSSSGVDIFPLFTAPAVNNAVRQNQIYGNPFKAVNLGSGANHDLPAPVLTSVTSNGVSTHIVGTLMAGPQLANTAFILDVFSTPQASGCHTQFGGEGAFVLPSASFMTDANGTANIDVMINEPVAPGDWVSTTATVSSAGTFVNDTSEYSLCVPAGAGQSAAPDAASSQLALTESALLSLATPLRAETAPLHSYELTQGGFSVNVTGTEHDWETCPRHFLDPSATRRSAPAAGLPRGDDAVPEKFANVISMLFSTDRRDLALWEVVAPASFRARGRGRL